MAAGMRFGPALLLMFLLAAAPAAARETLGTFGGWGAFRDMVPPRCYAIGEPELPRGQPVTGAFVSIATWPAAGVRGQVHVRLGPAAGTNRPAVLIAGERRFPLVRAGRDAWAPSPAADGAITAALRQAEELTIVVDGVNGGARYTDVYPLRGLATAMDAAALACARR